MSLLKITEQLKNLKSSLWQFNKDAESWSSDVKDDSFDRLNNVGYDKFVDLLMRTFNRTRDAYNIASHLLEFLESNAEPVSVEELEAMASLASEFENSGDSLLIQQSKILDSALKTLAEKKIELISGAEEKEIDNKIKNKYLQRELQEKYEQPKETIAELNKTKDLGKKYSEKMNDKTYRPQQHALSTRYCPEHPGVGTIFLSEGQYQCSLDKRVFNYKEGYTSLDGDKIPGGAVEYQNRNILDKVNTTVNYDTRESRSQKSK